MRHNYCARYANVIIRPLEEKDIEKLREWRNDPAQTTFLKDVGYITSEMQSSWFNNYLLDASQCIFAIDETTELNRIVGSLAVYEINLEEKTAAIGKIQIGDEEAHGDHLRRGQGRADPPCVKIAIKQMGLSKIVAAVSPQNIQAYTNDMKVGFRVVGSHKTESGIIEDEIEVTEDDLIANNSYYDEIELVEI